jgi:hypothetical protein
VSRVVPTRSRALQDISDLFSGDIFVYQRADLAAAPQHAQHAGPSTAAAREGGEAMEASGPGASPSGAANGVAAADGVLRLRYPTAPAYLEYVHNRRQVWRGRGGGSKGGAGAGGREAAREEAAGTRCLATAP